MLCTCAGCCAQATVSAFVLQECKVIISMWLCVYSLSSKQKGSSLPPKPILKDRPLDSPGPGPSEFQHLESWPGLHLPRWPHVGELKAQHCSRSQQRHPGRADPLAQQMELRLGEKVTPTPLAFPENQSQRRQPRRISHTQTTNSAASRTHRRAQKLTQPGTTTKSVWASGKPRHP